MSDYRKELTPIPGRADVRSIATARRMNALQDAVLELLDERKPKMEERKETRRAQRRPRFQVWYHTAGGRLYVGEGRVGVMNGGAPDAVVRPMMPTLNGTPLDADPAPYFSGFDGETDYDVLCIFSETAARMELRKADDPPTLNHCERAWRVATIRWAESFVVDAFEQEWSSDIPWMVEEVSCASSEGSSDDSEDSSEEPSDDSEDPPSSSDDSSDESSSSGDVGCCPEVHIDHAMAFLANFANGVDTANCFLFADTAEEVKVMVQVTVTGNPCDCKGAWLKVTVGAHSLGTRYMGFSGDGTYVFEGSFEAYACQTMGVTACWYTAMVGVDPGDPCLGQNCCASTAVTMPEVCGEGC